jgi:hypothetical protein
VAAAARHAHPVPARPPRLADHGWSRIRLDGGCQGCSLARVTIRQGTEPLLRARLAAVTGLTDTTDHEAGSDPSPRRNDDDHHPEEPGSAGPRVLLVPAPTYRAANFLLAATRLGLDVVIGSDGALPLGGRPVIPVNRSTQTAAPAWSRPAAARSPR